MVKKVIIGLQLVWTFITKYKRVAREIREVIEAYKKALEDGKITKQEVIHLSAEVYDVIELLFPAIHELKELFRINDNDGSK